MLTFCFDLGFNDNRLEESEKSAKQNGAFVFRVKSIGASEVFRREN
jgi:hypothetical protein